ncbi:winged helix-turn-helix domain-containing protein [soil metagenome]
MAGSSNTLPIGQARRIALAAQGLANPNREGVANWTRIERAVRPMKLLQIDSVNVLVRSHYLPVFSRAGIYDQAALDARTFTNRKRHFFEYWAHEASLLPLDLHPLMRWRMARAAAGVGVYKSLAAFARDEKSYVASVLAHIRVNGASGVSDIPDSGKRSGNWWGWSKGKIALEYLFDAGLLTTATRRVFERLYDLPERVIPKTVLDLPTPDEPAAIRRLTALSGEAMGVASEADLRDYFRLPVAESRRAVAELVEEGTLLPVTVQDWRPKAFLHKDAKLVRRANGTALLSPFDPLVWERGRAERLFDFRYRIEIYTPAPKRVFGYYVLPFLSGDRLAARVCLKADRQNNVLRVNSAFRETHAPDAETAGALAKELGRMAAWLGLPEIAAPERGDLAPALVAALAHR